MEDVALFMSLQGYSVTHNQIMDLPFNIVMIEGEKYLTFVWELNVPDGPTLLGPFMFSPGAVLVHACSRPVRNGRINSTGPTRSLSWVVLRIDTLKAMQLMYGVHEQRMIFAVGEA